MKHRTTHLAYTLIISILINIHSYSQETLSLAGKWRIALDGNFKDWPEKIGVSEAWFLNELPSNKSIAMLNQIYFKNADFTTNDWINLPGSTDEAQIGTILKPSQAYTPGLERVRTYDGAFWIQRKVNIPENWRGKYLTLFLERTLGGSTIYWDNTRVGDDYGLAFPHKIVIDKSVESGDHTLTILINKEDVRYAHFGHHGYGGNGSSWNGVVGRIELIAQNPDAQISNVAVYPQIKSGSIKLSTCLKGKTANDCIKILVRKKGEKRFILAKTIVCDSNSFSAEIKIPKPIAQWSEFTPNLYELRCELSAGNTILDSYTTTFGMREIGRKDGYITINENKVLMRGTLDCGSFPLTGYPYMNKEKWVEIMKIIKSYGLNHVRYHTWCPPEAAFAAADELGLYLQVELAGAPYSELNRILDTYGNHPSFCMLSLNNEVLQRVAENEKIVENAKLRDNRHLYTNTSHPFREGANDDFYVSAWGSEKTTEWPFHKRIVGITWGGGDVVNASRFNLFQPETRSNFSSEIKDVNAPIIAHEMGQWAMFPDLDEIDNYKTGVLRNTNYERIKAQLEAKGLLPYSKEFAKASGMLSSILYKEEIESIFRTPNYAGFQLLDLHDYQGQYISIVGILNDFWKSKGLVDSLTHRQYCDAVVPLVKMSKRVWTTNEQFYADVDIANYTFNDLAATSPDWVLKDTNNNTIRTGKLNRQIIRKGGLTPFSSINFNFENITKAEKLTLIVSLPNTTFHNSWNIWIFPKNKEENRKKVEIVNSSNIDSISRKLSNGDNILLLLNKETIQEYRESCFTTIFWNSIHKWMQKAHTMGIMCDPKHPVFTDFPTDFHSDWQWWDISMNAYAMNINNLPKSITPLIRVIDSYIVNDKLAYLWECRIGKGKLMVCSIDFDKDINNRPASNQLKNSILNYMNSDRFNPSGDISIEELKHIIK